jgi:hypothetical protein
VPTIRPTQPDTVIAMDVMPNGSPGDARDYGTPWIDVCDRDVLTSEAGAVGTACVAVFSDHVEIGARSFNGASDKQSISGPARPRQRDRPRALDPPKRHQKRTVTFLTAPEAKALIDAPEGVCFLCRRVLVSWVGGLRSGS